MAQLIPLFQDQTSDFTFDTTLGGQRVRLRIVANFRDQDFFIHEFSVIDQADIAFGLKIVKAYPILDSIKASLPTFKGDLITVKIDEEASGEITPQNFGNGWDLFYITEEELEEWKELNINNGFF